MFRRWRVLRVPAPTRCLLVSPPPPLQEYDKAIETYQEGLKHDPDNQELKEGLMRCVQAINKVGGQGGGWGWSWGLGVASTQAWLVRGFDDAAVSMADTMMRL